MIVGEFSGRKVSECKQLCKEKFIKEGLAINFGEPEDVIIARSGCECVVAATEQYFINYGDEAWKQTVHEAAKHIEFYHQEAKN